MKDHKLSIIRFNGWSLERIIEDKNLSMGEAYAAFDEAAKVAIFEDMDTYRVALTTNGGRVELRSLEFKDRLYAREDS